jgi:hypothetical protein
MSTGETGAQCGECTGDHTVTEDRESVQSAVEKAIASVFQGIPCSKPLNGRRVEYERKASAYILQTYHNHFKSDSVLEEIYGEIMYEYMSRID